MNFKKFYVIQYVIDDLMTTKKHVPKKLKELINVPEAKDFLICKKLNLIELYKFCNLLNFVVTKKIMVSYLNSLKYQIVGINKPFKLPVSFLQNIADFIENLKDKLTDNEYRHDLEFLMKFY